ncbi:hypothetical protein [Paenibacillus sp. 1P07SE]|uniref:hypothetical protein n=1 Tax=Paenibacillus sp. 1P07SE TaxID=3132209 RepID=UPI0039A7072D
MNQQNLATDQTDIDKHKAVAALGYIIFLIPILAARDSRYAMYHANQGLVLLLAAVAINIIGTVIPIVGWLLIAPLGMIGILILAILGILNAVNGQSRPLPLIGGIKLLK